MKTKLLILIFLLPFMVNAQNLYTSTSSEISFFSEAPLENIQAVNKNAKSIINTKSNEIVVVVVIKRFKFENSLMEEHFNENYMESDKYKTAVFKGKINDPVNFNKDGIYHVSADGELEVHGVKQKRSIEGTITVKGNTLTLNTTFNIALKDHNIKIPKAVMENIAEIMKVTAMINYEPKLD